MTIDGPGDDYSVCQGRMQWLAESIRDWRKRKGLETGWPSVGTHCAALEQQMMRVAEAKRAIPGRTYDKLIKHLPAVMEYARKQYEEPDPRFEAGVPKIVKWLFWHLWRPRGIARGESDEGDAIRELGIQLADAVIRLFDLSASLGYNIEEYVSWQMDRRERMKRRG